MTRQMTRRPQGRATIVRLHRWLGIGAAAIWMLQALTGILLSFHFEAEDALLGTRHVPTNPVAIEQRLDGLASAGGDARVNWIWTTAGLADRYIVSFATPGGEARKVYIDGAGTLLGDRPANASSVFGLIRDIHLTLVAGAAGEWILGIAGFLLVTNILFGLVVAWPRRGRWRQALILSGLRSPLAALYGWHRALGLWAAIPALLIVMTGSLMLFEHQVRTLVGASEVSLPANPATGRPVGFAQASAAAVAAIPGSRFVGTTLPSTEDASYYAWVRAPGELYRKDGYGSSLVIINANDGSVRGAWPATQASAAQAFIGSFYPLHTGEALGLTGRIFVLGIGVWLVATIILGLLLWWRKRPRVRS